MNTSKEVNQWLGEAGGYIRLPGELYNTRVLYVSYAQGRWILYTIIGIVTDFNYSIVIDHAVRVGDTLTLG